VLLIEDEPVLRGSMARGLGKMPSLTVVEAGNLPQALDLIDGSPPDVIVSDIDLPGRTGLELIGELHRRGLSIPILYVSAYLKAYRSQIPPNANVEVVEKPVPLEQLRDWISERVKATGQRAPFCAADYVQLAGMGRNTVEILVTTREGPGRILVVKGEVWSAKDPRGKGVAAFKRCAFHREGLVECRALEGDPGPRDIEAGAEALLIDAARELDEQNGRAPAAAPAPARKSSTATPAVRTSSRTGTPAAPPVRTSSRTIPAAAPRTATGTTPAAPPVAAAPPPPPPPPPEPDKFAEAWDRGIGALLSKDYPAALKAFLEARALRPDDPRVAANLKRLEDLGFHA
jgi:CheY-like chemotaxis protein